MAKNTAVHVVDDLTGEAAAETLGFGVDGIDYEIDLSARNAAALREIFAPYVRHGRRTGGRKQRPQLAAGAKTSANTGLKNPEPQEVPAKAKPAKRTAAGAKTAARPAKAEPAAKPTRAKKAQPAKAVKTTEPRAAAVKTTAAVKNPAGEPKSAKTAEPARRPAKKIPAVTFSSGE
ncbi:Lsr2 dimerization domain-containing protein [Amycolatopsis sp. NPDC004368]